MTLLRIFLASLRRVAALSRKYACGVDERGLNATDEAGSILIRCSGRYVEVSQRSVILGPACLRASFGSDVRRSFPA